MTFVSFRPAAPLFIPWHAQVVGHQHAAKGWVDEHGSADLPADEQVGFQLFVHRQALDVPKQ